MLKIDFSKQAEKFLRKSPTKHSKQIVKRIIDFANSPDITKAKELKGFKPFMRLKSGEYRIIFYLEEDILKIQIIGKRNDDDIYKRIKRFIK
jgi:mRNA interferase RelE/StbE